MNIISGFRGPSPEGGADHNEGKTRPRRVRGQTVILVALSMVALLAIVGLAVDGGAMYAQRRNAQNSSDAAAIAATRNMLTIYMTNNGGGGTAADEQTISNTLASLAAAHGISRSNLHAYYVNDNKQVVGAAEVGYLGGVPFSQGAKGIAVKDRSETNAFFMKLFGWNQVGASADSTAFLGIATDEGNTMSDMDGIFPVG